MKTDIEIKIIDNESYGYLWRVIKESFLAAGKPFYTTDVPHPDTVGDGWRLNYKWPHINRRIWFRLAQNAWKHRGILHRPWASLGSYQPFPRPLVVTAVVREIPREMHPNSAEDILDFYSAHEYSENEGWTEMFPHNLLVGDEAVDFRYPDGKFYLYTNSSVDGQSILANTEGNEGDPVFFYIVNTEYKSLGGETE